MNETQSAQRLVVPATWRGKLITVTPRTARTPATRPQLALAAAASLSAFAAAAPAAEIISLAGEPGGFTTSKARAISANGKHVTGYGGDLEAFRWNQAFGLRVLPPAPGEGQTLGFGISDDGETVAGRLLGREPLRGPFRWNAHAGYTIAGPDDSGKTPSMAVALSADGSTAVGIGGPFYWVAGQQPRSMPADGDGYTASSVWDVSADGTYLAGGGQPAYRWSRDGGYDLIDALPGQDESRPYPALGISADGGSVAGMAYMNLGSEAFIWSPDEGTLGLGHLAEHTHSSAWAVANSGKVVVGESGTGPYIGSARYDAFVWTPAAGMRPLLDVLTDAGIDMSGWDRLAEARDVSADGRWVVGTGITTDGETVGFVADLWPVPPGWVQGDANDDGAVTIADFAILRANFGADKLVGAWDLGDFDLDGAVTIADFALLRANFGTATPGEAAAMDAWAASVPEPASLAPLAAAGLALARRR